MDDAKSRWAAPSLWRVPAIAVLLFFAIVSASLSPASKDYISYWSAGHLLREQANPYAAPQVFALENGVGYARERPLVMRNPPWALPAVLPLGWMSARTGLIGWLAGSLGCIAFFLARCRLPALDWSLVCCFPPLLLSLITGQSSPILLLGLAGFLAWEARRPVLAGAMLWLLAFKPHAVFLLWPLLLAESVVHRKIRLLTAAVLVLCAMSAVAMLYDPFVWRHYAAMLRSEQIDRDMLPTPAFLLRYFIAPNATWIQLVPVACATVWAIWFFVRNREVWDWRVHSVPLVFVSVLVSPYVWFTDQALLLPAIATTLTHARHVRRSRALLIALTVVTLSMMLGRAALGSIAYSWTPLAWMAWYIYSRGWSSLRAPQDCIAV